MNAWPSDWLAAMRIMNDEMGKWHLKKKCGRSPILKPFRLVFKCIRSVLCAKAERSNCSKLKATSSDHAQEGGHPNWNKIANWWPIFRSQLNRFLVQCAPHSTRRRQALNIEMHGTNSDLLPSILVACDLAIWADDKWLRAAPLGSIRTWQIGERITSSSAWIAIF